MPTFRLAERDLEFSFGTFKRADQCEATDGELFLPFGKMHRSERNQNFSGEFATHIPYTIKARYPTK